MTAPQTHIFKSAYGWKATTNTPLEGRAILQIVTLKRIGGKLGTTARRVDVSEDGCIETFVCFQDFLEYVITETPARITEKAVADQHRRALLQLDAIKARCAAHYAQQSTATADATA